jgi:hypothetical protein
MSMLMILALAAAVPQTGDTPQHSVKDAADSFTIDSLSTSDPAMSPTTDAAAPDPVAVTTPDSEPIESRPADTSAQEAPEATSWLDVPIASLIANPTTKAVLDHDLPGLSSDANLPKFQSLSLRKFQPLTGGQLSDAMLQKVATDLNVAPPAPPPAARASNRRGER